VTFLKQSLGAIYLQDHHAAGVAGTRLARRVATAARNGADSAELDRVAAQIDEDLSRLEEIMRRLAVEPSRTKDVLSTIAERVARLKPNGRLLRRSPLSDLLELETLAVGIAGKRALWTSLREASAIPDAELATLIERADDQARIVETARVSAARRALAARG
jgi:hypothetical protein